MRPIARAKFEEFVREDLTSFIQYLLENGLFDPQREIVDFIRVAELAQSPRNQWPAYLIVAFKNSASAAAGLEYLAQAQRSLQYYQLGTYLWPHPSSTYPGQESAHDLGTRDSLRLNQLPAAVCNDRIGNGERARQLYEWAAMNSLLSDGELKAYGVDQVVWERLPWACYAFACLDRWDRALEVAEYNQKIIMQDRRAQTTESYQSPLKIHSVLLTLCRYKADSSAENRRAAIAALSPQSVASRAHPERLHALFYLYNLRARHPDLANPDPGELPPAERARQGYEACISWMAHGGLQLDGSVDSLRLLDQHLINVWEAMDPSQHRIVLFLVGSYVGEVIREKLAGGRWNYTEENMLAWTLDWEMGETEMHIHPYLHARQMVHGEAKKPFFQLWQEAETTYINLGLAAR